MVRRLTPAQYQAELRRQQRAIDDYNRKAQQHNARVESEVKEYNRRAAAHNAQVRADQKRRQREIDDYNRKAKAENQRTGRAIDAHNRQVRANRQRLAQEVSRLESQSRRAVIPYESSVDELRVSFAELERSETTPARVDPEMLDLGEGETANSVAALNAMLAEPADAEATDDEVSELQQTSIGAELAEVDPDLDDRWKGALFSLSPRNPDAARHFCTSAREMLSQLLETAAPDDKVVGADPACDRTPHGSVSRRARIRFCLRHAGAHDEALEDFLEKDMENVLALFAEFNKGTHGGVGSFHLEQLRAIKTRVEDAIRFVHRILPPATHT